MIETPGGTGPETPAPAVPETPAPAAGESTGTGRRSLARADAATFARVLALCLVLGAVAGLVWWRLAPRVLVVVTADGIELADPVTRDFVAADVWFAAITAVAGLAAAIIGVVRWRGAGIGLTLGEALGGLAGSAVAALLGQWLGRADVAAAASGARPGTVIEAALTVRAPGVLLVWTMVAMLVVLAVAVSFGIDDDPSASAPVAAAPPGPEEPAPVSPDGPPAPASPTSG